MAALQRSPAETPYQLDPAQTLKASTALLNHIAEEQKKSEAKVSKKNLLAAGHEDSSDEASSTAAVEPIQIVITTKKQIAQGNTLKPRKIPIPHSLHLPAAVSSICLITPDPQRSFKDAIASASFPSELGAKIRILGVEKLKARYKSFEQKRQLRDEYDVFLADDRIVPMLPAALGATFLKTSAKRPLPVSLSVRSKDEQGKTLKPEKKINSNKRERAGDEKEVSMLKPEAFAREIEKTLACAKVYLAPSVNTTATVGYSTFTPQQLAENVEAVVQAMTERFVPKGWRSLKSVHIKGLRTASLPVWQTSELWEDKEDVIEDGDKEKLAELEAPKSNKRRGARPRELAGGEDDVSKKMRTERKHKLRQQRKEAGEAIAAGLLIDT